MMCILRDKLNSMQLCYDSWVLCFTPSSLYLSTHDFIFVLKYKPLFKLLNIFIIFFLHTSLINIINLS